MAARPARRERGLLPRGGAATRGSAHLEALCGQGRDAPNAIDARDLEAERVVERPRVRVDVDRVGVAVLLQHAGADDEVHECLGGPVAAAVVGLLARDAADDLCGNQIRVRVSAPTPPARGVALVTASARWRGGRRGVLSRPPVSTQRTTSNIAKSRWS